MLGSLAVMRAANLFIFFPAAGKRTTISRTYWSVKRCVIYFANACSAPRKSARNARATHRMRVMITPSKQTAMAAATKGCLVANQVRNTAKASSPALRLILEMGSGEGVTAALAAVLPPWAAKAIAPPTIAQSICSVGESCAVAR